MTAQASQFNPFSVIPILQIVGRHGALIKAGSDMAPEVIAAFNDLWPHLQAALPHIEAALPHLVAANDVVVKHKPAIDLLEKMLPEAQVLVRELLPAVQAL